MSLYACLLKLCIEICHRIQHSTSNYLKHPLVCVSPIAPCPPGPLGECGCIAYDIISVFGAHMNNLL